MSARHDSSPNSPSSPPATTPPPATTTFESLRSVPVSRSQIDAEHTQSHQQHEQTTGRRHQHVQIRHPLGQLPPPALLRVDGTPQRRPHRPCRRVTSQRVTWRHGASRTHPSARDWRGDGGRRRPPFRPTGPPRPRPVVRTPAGLRGAVPRPSELCPRPTAAAPPSLQPVPLMSRYGIGLK